MIAVIGKNRELGKDNHLLWNIPADLKRFRAITKNHPVIMGRKTFESIGHALPDRANFVITRDPSYTAEGCTVVSSLAEAIERARGVEGSEELFVIGGASIYAQAIGQADRLYLTVVEGSAPDADAMFPDYSRFTKLCFEETHEEQGIRFTYRTLEPPKSQ